MHATRGELFFLSGPYGDVLTGRLEALVGFARASVEGSSVRESVKRALHPEAEE
jgi:hypothetical protein